MSTNFKTLYERYEYHLHELHRLTLSGRSVEIGTEKEHVIIDDPEKQKTYNSHSSEMRVLWDRIQKDFPSELAEYLNVEYAKSQADLDAAVEAGRQSLSQAISENREKRIAREKKLLDKLRAYEEKYP